MNVLIIYKAKLSIKEYEVKGSVAYEQSRK